MLTTVKGLIIRTVDIKESDRLITIFTAEQGIVNAIAKGARSLRSRQMSSTMQFCYGSYVLYKKGEYYWVRESELYESFFDLRSSLEGLALAQYFCEILSYIAVTEADPDLLRLSLNSLYAIASGKYPLDRIKAAFEIRSAAIIGFMPDVLECRDCGEKNGDFFLDVMGGNLQCYACHDKGRSIEEVYDDGHEAHIIALLSAGAKVALGYCVYSPLEKLFSFQLGEEDMRLFSRATEEYLINHLERSFKTLDFYNEVKR